MPVRPAAAVVALIVFSGVVPGAASAAVAGPAEVDAWEVAAAARSGCGPSGDSPAAEEPGGAEAPAQTDTLAQVEPAADTGTPADPAAEAAGTAGTGPTAHCSQGAGDQQYEDPFEKTKAPGEDVKGSNGGSPGSQGQVSQAAPASSTGTATPTAQETATAAAAAADDGSSLPNTGLAAAPLAGAGALLVLAGAALRRRLSAA
jgi:hypothetical protein